ncbi:hypothetical protein [Thermotalea metallivorans]|uniref:Coenzyme PQQ synthesis protein D n=1 Tax=Thermotalea metallivorans TaxID=520762 RepID=A0A140L8K2_9FIRM|nr:hypothetical protein [Thermotalea metallivorans]KXG76877.1 hypothetical protein AN619_08690 [Thermotalea metallivorans]
MKEISNRVFYRFEPNLEENGLLIVFFRDTEEIYEMTEPYYLFLKCLEKNMDREEQVIFFNKKYPNLHVSEIEENLMVIEKDLKELGVIV